MYEEEMPKVSNLYSNLKGSNEFIIPKMFILTRLNKDRGPTRNPAVTRLFRPSVLLYTRS